MIKAFLGDDVIKVRGAAHHFLEQEGDSATRLSAESYEAGSLPTYAYAESLFGKAEPVLLDFPSDDSAFLDDALSHVEALAESARVFVLMDYAPTASVKKALAKAGVAIEVVASAPEGERFNTFALAEAFARRDKKALWVLYARAREAGIESEEIIGILFWQLKALRLAENTGSAREAGMKDFPYNKAKSALKAWAGEDLGAASQKLLAVYHRGHFDQEIDIALERFVLSI